MKSKHTTAATETINSRKKLLSVAVATALATTGGAALAQDDEEQTLEEVIVTGYRQSLIDSIGTKRDSAQIVEAISAEDIGKLPDQSIADSLARLPGLAAQRLDGRASSISIRGLGEDFSTTTVNGREQVTIGDNRGVEFDLYPSEVVSGLVVYKTPNASLSTQGIAGVINMETVRPLNYKERIVKLSYFYEENDIGKLNPDGEDIGGRITGSYIDQFADGKVGVALVVNNTKSPTNEEQWHAWGFDLKDVEYPADSGEMVKARVLNGAKPYVRSSELERDSYIGVLQFQPNDLVSVTADYMNIDFFEENILRGIEVPGWGQGGNSITTVSNGVVTQGTFTGRSPQVRNDYETRDADLESYGLNVELALTDQLTLTADLAHSEVERTYWSLESYATRHGYATGNKPDASQLGYTLGGTTGAKFTSDVRYNDFATTLLGPALPWGNWNMAAAVGRRVQGTTGTTNAFRDADPAKDKQCHSQMYGTRSVPCPEPVPLARPLNLTPVDQDGFINSPTVEDELDSFRLDVAYSLDGNTVSKIDAGIYYSDRSKKNTDSGFYLSHEPSRPVTPQVPEQFRLGTINLDFLGFEGGMIAYDSNALYRSGFYKGEYADPDHGRFTNNWTVDEEITMFYAMADLDLGLFGMDVQVNVGLQYIDTDQSSDGRSIGNIGVMTLKDGNDNVRMVEADDPNSDDPDDKIMVPETVPIVGTFATRGGDSYTELLPSLSVNLQLTEESVLRLAASRTLSRSQMKRMNAGNSINYDPAKVDSTSDTPWSVSGGNPALKPNMADQFDISYEYYFREDGYVALAAYRKELLSWQTEEQQPIDLTTLIPASIIADFPDKRASWTRWTDRNGGEITGYEFSFAMPFGMVTPALEGFGLNGGIAWVDSSLEDGDGNDTDVPGLSDRVINMTAYYERGGFKARVSVRERDDFTGERYGLSFSRETTLVVGDTLWDAQVSYDFEDSGIEYLEGLSLTFQALNITDEPFENLNNRTDRLTRDYQEFGATYQFGVSYQF